MTYKHIPIQAPPCDPMHPAGGFYVACEITGGVTRGNRHRRYARPVTAYRNPAVAMQALDDMANCPGFFHTYVLIDPVGRVVGRYSMTSMAHNPNSGKAAPSALRYPQMLAGVFDRDGINIDELPDYNEQRDEDLRRIVDLVAAAETEEYRRQREADPFGPRRPIPVRLRRERGPA